MKIALAIYLLSYQASLFAADVVFGISAGSFSSSIDINEASVDEYSLSGEGGVGMSLGVTHENWFTSINLHRLFESGKRNEEIFPRSSSYVAFREEAIANGVTDFRTPTRAEVEKQVKVDIHMLEANFLIGYYVWRDLSILINYRQMETSWDGHFSEAGSNGFLSVDDRKEKLTDSGIMFGAGYLIPFDNSAINISVMFGSLSSEKETRIEQRFFYDNNGTAVRGGGFDSTSVGGDNFIQSYSVKYSHTLTQNSVWSVGAVFTLNDWDFDDSSKYSQDSYLYSLGWSYRF